jgi:hypothetical protein
VHTFEVYVTILNLQRLGSRTLERWLCQTTKILANTRWIQRFNTAKASEIPPSCSCNLRPSDSYLAPCMNLTTILSDKIPTRQATWDKMSAQVSTSERPPRQYVQGRPIDAVSAVQFRTCRAFYTTPGIANESETPYGVYGDRHVKHRFQTRSGAGKHQQSEKGKCAVKKGRYSRLWVRTSNPLEKLGPLTCSPRQTPRGPAPMGLR